ncbi:MAG: LEA type 2 family protein [Phycisphaerales bacterium]|jgi:LEA14-like dessication related protein|nr:LEA type 2 family protein [Phycisphaerales bacterium]
MGETLDLQSRWRPARGRSALLAIAMVSAWLGGCASPRPEVGLAEVRLRERTDAGAVLALTLDLRNENDIALPLRSLSYSVTVDGREVFRGERSPEATLARFSAQTIEIPAAVRFGEGGVEPDLISGEREVRVDGTIRYLAPGALAELLFDTGLRRPKVTFTREARVELSPTVSSAN